MVTGVKARRQNHHPRWRQDKQLPGIMPTNLVVSAAKSRRQPWGKAVFLQKQLGAVRLAFNFAKKRLECDIFDEKYAFVHTTNCIVNLKSFLPPWWRQKNGVFE